MDVKIAQSKRMLEIIGSKVDDSNDLSGFNDRTQDMVGGVYDLLRSYGLSKVDC